MQPKTKRILFGCLGGCGLVVVLGIGSCVSFAIWIKSPGEVLQPEILRGSDTTGYAEWTLRLEDPGTAEFVEGMLQRFSRLNRRANSPLPDGLERLINMQQAKSARKDVNKFFPLVVAWTVHPGTELEEDEHLFSASARGLSHQLILVDWVMGFVLARAKDVETVRHAGERIHIFSESEFQAAVFLRRGAVFVATDLDSARQAIDRLTRPTDGQPGGDQLDALLAGLDAAQPLRGALTNRRGELLRLLDVLRLPDEHASHAGWDEVRGATISARFRDQSTFAGVVELHGPDADWASAHAPALGAALIAVLDRSDLEFSSETHAAGDRIRVEFSTTDLLGEIERRFGRDD